MIKWYLSSRHGPKIQPGVFNWKWSRGTAPPNPQLNGTEQTPVNSKQWSELKHKTAILIRFHCLPEYYLSFTFHFNVPFSISLFSYSNIVNVLLLLCMATFVVPSHSLLPHKWPYLFHTRLSWHARERGCGYSKFKHDLGYEMMSFQHSRKKGRRRCLTLENCQSTSCF